MSKIAEAMALCIQAHEGQVRKNGAPYWVHPAAVMNLVFRYFYTHPQVEELAIAALLHDVVEDTDIALQRIESQFGPIVAGLVLEVTNNPYLMLLAGSKVDYMRDKLENNITSTGLALKLCDRLHNISDMWEFNADKRERKASETFELIDYLNEKDVFSTEHYEIAKDIREECGNYFPQQECITDDE